MRSRWIQATRKLSLRDTTTSAGGLVRVLAGGVTAAISGMFLARVLSTLAQVLIGNFGLGEPLFA